MLRTPAPFIGALDFSINYPKSEIFYERLEIVVVVQQDISALDASCCNEGINCLTYRNPESPQSAKVPCCLNGNIYTPNIHDIQRREKAFRFVEVTIPLCQGSCRL